MNNAPSGLLTALGSYVAQPFSEDMDLTHWFLFLGLALIILIIWALILKQVAEIAA